ncbi:hypothetical protein [Nocardia lijiangensis]|uniref:hypothetical protein n=1 Tax=Nocardia lijiangensis TaxID=299618 RepID=UPI000835FAF7|nr:hypothetical protein [Nocardia lijiangensis]
MRGYDNYLRWLYRHGRPNLFARIQNRFSAWLFAAGIAPRWVAALGVRGRRSGRVIWFPVVLAEFDGGRYVVSMLGRDANWVRNVAAADGHAVLCHGGRETVHLAEVEPGRRAPILRQYLRVAPGARPHIPAGPNAPLADYERIASDYPVFQIEAEPVD